MKSLLAILVLAVLSLLPLQAQQQVNIVSSDCDGTEHNLYTELDSGMVVVLCWVMPCPDCIGPMAACSKLVGELDAQYPGRVRLYVFDDFGNTSCLSLQQWAASYGVWKTDLNYFFSDASVKMSDFGAIGMPKIVALAGKSHFVIYSHENVMDSSALRTTMTNALSTADEVTPLTETGPGYTMYPNPATSVLHIDGLNPNEQTAVLVLTINGAEVLNLPVLKQTSGHAEVSLEGLADDHYLVEISTNHSRRIRMICVQR